MSNANLETFVNNIRSLYQKENTTSANYIEIFNSINSQLFTLTAKSTYTSPELPILTESIPYLLDNALPVFNLPEYTLPHMSILYAIVMQVNLIGVDTERLLSGVENCLHLADYKQVEIASEIYSELCHYYTRCLVQQNKPKRGLLTLRTAIRNIQLDSTGTQVKTKLTTVHSDLLQLSLMAKNFTVALDVMSHEILDIHKPPNSKFDSKYLLGYFYYAGCVYTAMKLFDKALFYFEQTLSVPALVVSQIMVEAFKKYILIALISKGKLLSLPKYTSRIVLNHIKPMCSIYHEIAVAFMNFDAEKLNTLCQKYHNSFEADRNLGLIKQLQQSFYKSNIQKLTKTFITLSLSDMALKVKLPSAKEAETCMLNMIKDGDIFATINQKAGMVSFHDNPEKYDNPQMTDLLTKQIFQFIEMDANIKQMDKQITTHPQYIQKCQNTSLVDDTIDSLQTTANLNSIYSNQI